MQAEADSTQMRFRNVRVRAVTSIEIEADIVGGGPASRFRETVEMLDTEVDADSLPVAIESAMREHRRALAAAPNGR